MDDSALRNLLELAIDLNRQDHLDLAESTCTRLLGQAPDHPVARHLLGVILCRKGDLAGGEAVLRAVLRDHPDRLQALRHLGDALHTQGRYGEAIAVFANLTARSPDDPALHLLHGVSLQAGGLREAAVDAYLRAVALDDTLVQGFFNLGTVLHDLGRMDQAINAYARALDLDPNHAEAYLNLGNVLNDLERRDEALTFYDLALTARPGWVDAESNRGLLLIGLDRVEEGIDILRRLRLAAPDNADALTNLGSALQRAGRLDEAIDNFRLAAALRPDNPQILGNLAQALQGRDSTVATAEDLFQRALGIDGRHAGLHVNYAMHLLRKGDFPRGWAEYEWRWRGGVKTLLPRDFSQPQWTGEDLDGRTLLVHAEQGYGDSVQFARFIPLAVRRGARVVVEAQPALVSLLGRIDGVSAVIARGDPLPPFDRHVPMMSLPHALGLGQAQLGMTARYIAPDPALSAVWERRIAPPSSSDRRIGVAWAGNPRNENNRLRAIPSARLLDRLDGPGRRVFSLQKDLRQGDAETLAERAGRVVPLGKDLTRFDQTVALIACLDLVVTIDNVVAHLAGALGKPVWLLLPHLADWRWLRNRDDSPWYPSARLFRQPAPGDWDSVLDRVATALDDACLDRRGAIPPPVP